MPAIFSGTGAGETRGFELAVNSDTATAATAPTARMPKIRLPAPDERQERECATVLSYDEACTGL